MLGTGLYLLAVVFVLATLLRQSELGMGGITLGMIGLAGAVHYLSGRIGRSQLAAGAGLGLALLVVVTVRLSGLGWGPALIAAAVVVMAVAFAAGHPGSLQAVVTATVPAAALVLALILDGQGPAAWIPLEILLWSLPAWPALALFSSGRRWALTSIIGVAALLLVIQRLLRETDGMPLIALDVEAVGRAAVDRREGLLALGQALLVMASVGPQLMHSAARWRWTALFGTLGIAGPIALAVVTGPWADGWPDLVWWTVLPAIGVLLLGVVGMLCTTRQPELLADHAVRTIALGIGASATLLLPLLHAPKHPADLVPALAAAAAPLALGLTLGLVLSVTGLIARRNDHEFNTTTLLRMKVRPRLRASMLAFGRQMVSDVRSETRRWWSPHGVVPLVVLFATWPAFDSLGLRGAVVPVLALVAALVGGLVHNALPLWTALIASLLLIAGISLGLEPTAAIAATAMGVAAAWPFVRWSALNTAWAYCAGLMVLVLLWPALGGAPERRMVLSLALGISVLVTNALAPTGARWLVLCVSALWLLVFLADWIPAQDPYFPLLLKSDRLWIELGYLAVRLPLMALVLITLWVSRHRVLHPQWRSPPWQRALMGTLGVAAAAVWAIDLGEQWLTGALAWSGLVAITPMVRRELSDSNVVDDREPLVDAGSFVVAILIVAAGHASAVVAAAGDGAVEPGVMGVILIDAVRDLLALGVALGALLALSGLSRRSQLVCQSVQAVGALRTGMRQLTVAVTHKHSGKT